MPGHGIRLILDQGLPRDAAQILRNDGWECEHLRAFARELNAVIVTLDADFHMLLALSMAVRPSVIRRRL